MLARHVSAPSDNFSAQIKGDPNHPANIGRLCSKGLALGETLSLEDRLLHPSIEGRRASWGAALDHVASRFKDTIRAYGPDSVAMYVSGQLLTEDYYVANKFMKGFVGTANIDTNSRLCMSSSVAGHKRAYGTDTMPGAYEDLECADLVVLVGSNLAWCHPVLYQRLADAREKRGTNVVVVDPRNTATCAIADLHLPIKPGADVALFNGLLAYLGVSNTIDREFLDRATTGWNDAVALARELSFEDVVTLTELAPDQITAFFELFEKNERVVTVYSQGVNQSSAGTDKVNSIINCHLATGRIGRPGMGPFSITGQPNAMGGREVGGLSNTLAAHMELDNSQHRRIVGKYWGVPSVPDRPGYKAVELFNAIRDQRIKAVWIMATNPVDSLPDANAFRAALEQCSFVVVSDITSQTDTAKFAHVLLPAAAWGEKDGTVTNSERRISRQRSFLEPPGEAKPDWWHVCEVAKRFGFDAAFDYAGPQEIYAEFAALTGAENNGTRDLDISAHATISREAYDQLEPFQWPTSSSPEMTSHRFFGDGRFYTTDQRARIVAVSYRPPATTISGEFPFVLNTGRIRDQWHTMTRTGKTPRLLTHIAEPFVEIHPNDAFMIKLEPAGLARIRSAFGQMIARVSITDRQRRGSVFVPMHWTDQFSTSGRVAPLVAPNTDPVSGQPESKFGAVSVEPYDADWYGFAVSLNLPTMSEFEYAARSRAGDGYRLEFASKGTVLDWEGRAIQMLSPDKRNELQIQAYADTTKNQFRFAAFSGEFCEGLLFVAREPVSVSRNWAEERLGTCMTPEERLHVVAGRPGCGAPDRGPIVCACFGVGANEIIDAVTVRGCQTVAEVGASLKAGTNCGSCRSEIGRLVDDYQFKKAV